MAFMAVLETDLRALSAEARRRYPTVKDGAEHAILKLRSLSNPSEIAHNEDILRIFLMACEVKSVKLSVIGLSCLQKLISHDAVAPSALKEILSTLKAHAEMVDESVQLKTLQTILIIFQSRLHPESEDNMAQALGICLRLLENNRSSDSVRNTAAATFRQAVALIFDRVICAESLPAGKVGSGSQNFRIFSVTGDVSRSINRSESLESDCVSGGPLLMRESLTKAGKLGLRLLEDLTALAAGGSVTWLRVNSLQQTFALDILEFILSNYVAIFRTLVSYEQVLRHQICSLLMTSLRTNAEIEGEAGEPSFRRLVMRSVAHVIRLYSSFLVTECEVFLSMLIRVTSLDLPLWHRILVLEVLRGFCVEARTLRLLFQNFDMNPKNTNIVEGMVKALARVVSSIQVTDTSEESLAAVAGMFNSKAKGIEWSLDNDASNAAVVVASEAHAITLAVEGLLGVVFTVAALTDEAVDVGEVESPRDDSDQTTKCTGQMAVLCMSMVDSMWLTILDALSLILTRSQGEAIILEILKGYQAFTQACGVLCAVEPLNSFLASLCKFTISVPNEAEKRSSVLLSPSSKRSESLVDQRDSIVLTPKNVQALRTLFNVAHRLHNVLGPSWVLVLETLAALDRAIHSPHATIEEVSTSVPKLTRESSGLYSDFNILSSLNSQLFESSALMNISAVKSLLSALCQLSNQYMPGNSSGFGQTSSQQVGNISFSVERMISILVNNLHRVEPLWDQVVGHLLELAEHNNQQFRNLALDAFDQSICAVLGSDKFQSSTLSRRRHEDNQMESTDMELGSFECAVISPLCVLYFSNQNLDVRIGSLKILQHVLERHGEKLYSSWPSILDMLRSVANAVEKEIISLGFQGLRVIMNDELSTIPSHCIDVCIEVTGAYSSQKTELNISLTAVGLLWTTTDFIAKGLIHGHAEEIGIPATRSIPKQRRPEEIEEQSIYTSNEADDQVPVIDIIDHNKLLFSVFSLLQKLGADERPEVRNSAIRTLFQTLGSHGQKLSRSMWEDCLWNYVFPTLDCVSHMAASSSTDEWQGKELGMRGGKAVHMLIHHSRNTAQKQWDETLVLVLGGIARLLRSFFPFLRSLSNFWSGWESLLVFVRNSILNGSKEVALAAVNCLQTIVLSHSPKGNLPIPYLKSVLDVYELVLQRRPNYSGNAASKVKQEILHGLGEIYMQAQKMFDEGMYMQLLEIIHLAVGQPKYNSDNTEAEIVHVPPVQRTMLEILPQLCPTEHLSSMWNLLLRELLHYLPGSEASLEEKEAEMEQASSSKNHNQGVKVAPQLDVDSVANKQNVAVSKIMLTETHNMTSDFPNGVSATSLKKTETPFLSSGSPIKDVVAGFSSNLFGEKLVPVLVEIFLLAPSVEKYNIFPEMVQGLGRCMATRRDTPDGALWRLAVEGFNRILVDDVNSTKINCGRDSNVSRTARIRLWKEVADIYEIFLVGSCGRALPSNVLSPAALKADESVEMTILNVLGDKILKMETDIPVDILERLVSTLDRCASRTCCLPVETVRLLPSHSSSFSLACLQKLFSLCYYTCEVDQWNSTRSEVSKIAIMVLVSRCEYILRRFLIDENELGERSLPAVRIEEIIFVLQELARLVIHPDTASILSLPSYLRDALAKNENHDGRAHLLVLFPSLCELVILREARVRELVQVLLRLVSTELGLQKVS
ncbi:protein MON2 homolog isoform X2 [Telopea speciosissima]|uniref:protein MON2 homolog isoform X2 n=1 Tax=Telopea speciosissima TaxID=54955 RepID=UPI001CC71A62|nr:protein MON2 homolog isoform X2 [Telopea speciosissima]